MTPNSEQQTAQRIRFEAARHRLSILHHLNGPLETLMAFLSAVWLALMVVELGWGLSQFGQRVTTTIWIVFVLDFLLKFSLAPRKMRFLRTNSLTVVSLLLPALRIFRLARVFRVFARLRGVQLVRILGSINRGMKVLGKTMHRRGMGYIAALTAVVTLAGAAGMFFFERGLVPERGLNDFWTALWWTAMIMSTMGSEYWPRSAEGRALCLFLALYAFAVFGYFTGAIATYFIGRDAEAEDADVLGKKDIEALRKEIAALREETRLLRNQ